MIEDGSALERLRAISKTSVFNEWLGIEVTAASEGRAELQLAWRNEFGQYSGFLHAGIMGALIDTACGFAAVTITATVLASHNSVSFFQAGGRGTIHRSRQDFEVGETADLLSCRGLWRSRRGQAAARQRRNHPDDGGVRAALAALSFPSPLRGGVRGGGATAGSVLGDPHPRPLPARGRGENADSELQK